MSSDFLYAGALGALSFIALRGRRVRGDIVLALLISIYTVLATYHIVTNHPTLLPALVRPLWLMGTFLTVFTTLFVLYRLSPFHPLASIPGPLLNRITELPLAYSAFKRTRFRYLYELHEAYGPLVRIAPYSVSINSRTAVPMIYSSSQCFNKTPAYDLHMKGEGLFFIKDRDRHAVRRRPWNKALSSEAIAEYTDPLFRTTQNLVERILRGTKEDGEVDLAVLVMHWAFDIMGLITFGGNGFDSSLLSAGDPLNIINEARETLSAFELLGHVPWLFDIVKHFPSANFRRFETFSVEQARRRLTADKLVFRDMFSYWLDELDEDATPVLEDLAVDSEVAILAGTETIGSMIALLFFFILSHPTWQTALTSELLAAFTEHTPLGPATAAALDTLPVLNAVITEGLRLGAVFGGLHRVVPPGGACIDGHGFAEGVTVSVPIWAQHRQEGVFGGETGVFDPQRWLPGGSETRGKADRAALLAFSSGPFSCVGQKLAIKELKIVLAVVFLLLDVKTRPDFDPARFWAGVGNLRATVITQKLEVTAAYRAGGAGVVFPSS